MSDGRLPVRRRWLGWTIGIFLTLLLLAVGWVTVRGLGAAAELQHVARTSAQLKSAIVEGDLDEASVLADRVSTHAASAHSLTADPVWHAFGFVPWLGPNFSAVAEIAEIADEVASGAVTPVLDAAGQLDLGSLGLSGGAINLAPFAAIEKPLGEADAVLASADARAGDIDAGATLPPLADAVRLMQKTMTEASTVVGTLHGAAALLPTMLGAQEPRTYVLAMQNNAEVRSTGGIIGAIALLRAENGRISLAQQSSTVDFPALDTALPLGDSTIALFEDRPGRYLQNITSIPDFTESGPLIAARWTQRYGDDVDGVIAVDAVMMSHLLDATGPLTFGPFTADADNVVDLLLSEIYAVVPDDLMQDEIFAQASGALFSAALSTAQPKALLSALATSAAENRIRFWSAHEEEQRQIETSTLSGALPSDVEAPHVGVLFNDATGAKMDYYTDAVITTAVGECAGQPTTQVTVSWTSNAPADAATALDDRVTGAGVGGVPPGDVRTLIAIYGPEGATASRIESDAPDSPTQTALLGTRTVVQHSVQLSPGGSASITIDFVGEGAGSSRTEVNHTPLIRDPAIERVELRCAS